jgi:hypothetical protein
MNKPIFAFLLCRMANGTVAKLRTHRVDSTGGDAVEYKPLRLSQRQLYVMHNAERVTAPDVNGNANQQARRKS